MKERITLFGERAPTPPLVTGIILFTFLLNGWGIQKATEAAEERNPFALPAGVQKGGAITKKDGAGPAKAGPESVQGFRVTTILISGRNKVAGINGVLRQIGDELNGYRLTEIEEKQVTLSRGKEKLTVKIDPELGYSFKEVKTKNPIMEFSK